MAKWAVGCRTASTDATQIEAALNRGDILRTHLLRPTWHFVSSKDLRWMLSLTADRIRAANDSYARGTDAALDSKSIHRYMNLLQKTLEGNKHRTKEEIGEALNQRGIPLSQYALRHLLMRAETDGIVCSGIFRIPQRCGSRSVRHDASAARLRSIPDRLQGPFGRPCKRAHLQSLQLPRNFPTGYPLRRTDRRQLETNRRTRERHHTNDLMGKCRPQSTGCRRRTVPFVHRRNKVGKQSGGFVK